MLKMVYVSFIEKGMATRSVSKIAKNAFCKKALWYKFQEKTQDLYRITKKKEQGKIASVYKFL